MSPAPDTPKQDSLAWLMSAGAVRERAHALLAVAERGELDHFAVRPERLAAAADLVAVSCSLTR